MQKGFISSQRSVCSSMHFMVFDQSIAYAFQGEKMSRIVALNEQICPLPRYITNEFTVHMSHDPDKTYGPIC